MEGFSEMTGSSEQTPMLEQTDAWGGTETKPNYLYLALFSREVDDTFPNPFVSHILRSWD